MGGVAGSRGSPTSHHCPRQGPSRLGADGPSWPLPTFPRNHTMAPPAVASGTRARPDTRAEPGSRQSSEVCSAVAAPPRRGCGSAAWWIDPPAPGPSAPAAGQPHTSPLPPPLPLNPVCGSQMSTPSPPRRGRRGRRGSVFYMVSSFCTLAGSVPTKRNKRASPGASPPSWTISSRSSFIRVPKALR